MLRAFATINHFRHCYFPRLLILNDGGLKKKILIIYNLFKLVIAFSNCLHHIQLFDFLPHTLSILHRLIRTNIWHILATISSISKCSLVCLLCWDIIYDISTPVSLNFLLPDRIIYIALSLILTLVSLLNSLIAHAAIILFRSNCHKTPSSILMYCYATSLFWAFKLSPPPSCFSIAAHLSIILNGLTFVAYFCLGRPFCFLITLTISYLYGWIFQSSYLVQPKALNTLAKIIFSIRLLKLA